MPEAATFQVSGGAMWLALRVLLLIGEETLVPRNYSKSVMAGH